MTVDEGGACVENREKQLMAPILLVQTRGCPRSPIECHDDLILLAEPEQLHVLCLTVPICFLLFYISSI